VLNSTSSDGSTAAISLSMPVSTGPNEPRARTTTVRLSGGGALCAIGRKAMARGVSRRPPYFVSPTKPTTVNTGSASPAFA
jgi:hypothetical protein